MIIIGSLISILKKSWMENEKNERLPTAYKLYEWMIHLWVFKTFYLPNINPNLRIVFYEGRFKFKKQYYSYDTWSCFPSRLFWILKSFFTTIKLYKVYSKFNVQDVPNNL